MTHTMSASNSPVELFTAEQIFRNIDGIYAIFACIGTSRFPIDVGESSDVGNRLHNHDRKSDWFALSDGLLERGIPVVLKVYVTQTPSTTLYPKSYRIWVEWFWRTYYKALGYLLYGQRP